MKIGFFAQSCLPFHGRTLDERPLGGTETGIIRLAAELGNRGHEVIVMTSHPDPVSDVSSGAVGGSGSVRYVTAQSLPSFAPFDIFVAVKDWRAAFFPHRSKRLFFLTGDGPEQLSTVGLGDGRVEAAYEKILCVSQWHRLSLAEASGLSIDRIAVIGNGIHPPDYVGKEERMRKRLIFTSAPYRGLQLMPPIYRVLKERHPDLELHVFSGMKIYDTDKPFEGPHNEFYAKIASELRQLKGVVLHGNVLQKELAREYMRSSVFVYPNVVWETFCITALEAQAAGCPVVCSQLSALPETVGDAGFVIPGPPGSPEYMQQFTLAVDRLLTDDALWSQMSQRGLERVATRGSWSHVADRFLAII